MPGFAILHESDACLAVGKPPGLLTQAPPGIDSLEVRVREYLRGDDSDARAVYLGVPHRLDRPASGALVLGKTRRAARKLSRQFENRTVTKVYWACVEGAVGPPEGTWRDCVRKIPNEARAEVIEADHPEAQLAVLSYRVLAVRPWGSWLEVELHTGRTHQVRVQSAARGHPLLGDSLYGSSRPFGPRHEDERLRAIALHARSLGFLHPATREPVTVTAPVSADWTALGIAGEEAAADQKT